MSHPLLKCKCGALFENDGVFVTCPNCRKPYTPEQRQNQGGCRHWEDVPDQADRRVTRHPRNNETF